MEGVANYEPSIFAEIVQMPYLIAAFVGLISGYISFIVVGILLEFVFGASRVRSWDPVMEPIFYSAYVWGPLSGVGLLFISETLRKARIETEARRKAELQTKRNREIEIENSNTRELEASRLRKIAESEMAASRLKAIELFESIPETIACAEKYLDVAVFDFSDSAFAPFWDNIEECLRCLAQVSNHIEEISRLSHRYQSLQNEYGADGPISRFSVSLESAKRIGSSINTVQRMNIIIRKAQKNPHFANIYELRRSNEILSTGFSSLKGAIYGMNESIASRLSELIYNVETFSDNSKESASEFARREEEALEMLDNIQRRRRPD